LRKIPTDGGAIVQLGQVSASSVRGICWVGDTIILGAVTGGLRAVHSNGGAVVERTPIPSTTPATSLRWPVVLEPNRSIAFVTNGGGSAQEYWTQVLD